MQQPPRVPAGVGSRDFLHAVAPHCDAATLRALCLGNREACLAARRAGSISVTLPGARAGELAAAITAGRLPALRAATIGAEADSGAWAPPDALLAALARPPTLRALALNSAALGGSRAVLLAACTQLESLGLLGCELGDAGAGALAAALTRLTSLDVNRCGLTADSAVLFAACTQLESLSLSGCDALGDGGARELATALTRLTSLDVSSCGLTADGAAALAALPRLQSLHISDNHLGDDGGAALGALTGLTHLGACSVGCPRLLRHVHGLTRLEGLKVHTFWETHAALFGPNETDVDEAQAHLTTLTSLRRLRTLEGPPIGDGELAALPGALTALTRVSSEDCDQLGAPGLAALGRMPLVELSLRMAGARGAAPAGLAPLAPTLRMLALTNSAVDDTGAAAIARLIRLTSLHLHQNHITGEGVAALASGLAGLRHLGLAENYAGAADVAPLSALTALTSLSVDWESVDREPSAATVVAHALMGCRLLVSLRLHGGKGLTPAAKDALLNAMPQLEELDVVSDDGW